MKEKMPKMARYPNGNEYFVHTANFQDFYLLNDIYFKYYCPSKYLAVDEVTPLFKGRIVFKQYIPKKHISGIEFRNYVTRLLHMTPILTTVKHLIIE